MSSHPLPGGAGVRSEAVAPLTAAQLNVTSVDLPVANVAHRHMDQPVTLTSKKEKKKKKKGKKRSNY